MPLAEGEAAWEGQQEMPEGWGSPLVQRAACGATSSADVKIYTRRETGRKEAGAGQRGAA